MKKNIYSINPFNNEVIGDYRQYDLNEVELIIKHSSAAYNKWKIKKVEDRIRILSNIKNDLNQNLDSYANLITLEMGKPIIESVSEIKKCISLCEYYFLNGVDFLKPEILDFESKKVFLVLSLLELFLVLCPGISPSGKYLDLPFQLLFQGIQYY